METMGDIVHQGMARALPVAMVSIALTVSSGWAQGWSFEATSDTVCVGTPGATIVPPTERVRAGSDTLRLSGVRSGLLGPGYVEINDTTAVRLRLQSGVEIVLRKPPCESDPTREIRNALYEIGEDTLRIIRGIAVVDGDAYNVQLGDETEPVSVGSRVSFFVDGSKDLYLFYLRKGEVRADGKSFKHRGQLASYRESWEPVAPDSVEADLTAAWFRDFTDHSLGKLWGDDPLWKKPIFIGGAVAFVVGTSCLLEFIICDRGPPSPTTGGITIPLPNP